VKRLAGPGAGAASAAAAAAGPRSLPYGRSGARGTAAARRDRM